MKWLSFKIVLHGPLWTAIHKNLSVALAATLRAQRITARPRQTCDQPSLDRIARARGDHRSNAGYLGGRSGRAADGHDNVDIGGFQFLHQIRRLAHFARPAARLVDEVFSELKATLRQSRDQDRAGAVVGGNIYSEMDHATTGCRSQDRLSAGSLWARPLVRQQQIFLQEQFAQIADRFDGGFLVRYSLEAMPDFAPWLRPADPHRLVDVAARLAKCFEPAQLRRILDNEWRSDREVIHGTMIEQIAGRGLLLN
jgi:hypothetical protein